KRYEIKFSNFSNILSGAGIKAIETIQQVLKILSDEHISDSGKKKFFKNSAKFSRSGTKTPALLKKFVSSLSYDNTDTIQPIEEDTDTIQQEDDILTFPSTSTADLVLILRCKKMII
ncbi:repeat-containing C domain protein, partial [Orientia tsutsugamushi str. UT144]